MDSDPLAAARASSAATNLAGHQTHRALVQSIAATTRAVWAAQACSVQRLDAAAGELVFEAVAGQGEGALVGRRFPADRGIAGWTLATQQSIVVDNVTKEPTFAREVAKSTGYVPQSIMAAPLVRDDSSLGVMEVLDATTGPLSAMDDLDLLALFAHQAALALEVTGREPAAGTATASADIPLGEPGELNELLELATAIRLADGPTREAALRLLATVRELLDASRRE